MRIMRKLCLLIIGLLGSCKAPQTPLAQQESPDADSICVLKLMPETLAYGDNIGDFAAIYSDTVITLETSGQGSKAYRTMVQLNPRERFVWLLAESPGKPTDSLLLHCLTPNRLLDTEFDAERCFLFLEDSEFDTQGNPVSVSNYMKNMADWPGDD